MGKKAVIRLQLDVPAKQQLDKLCDRRGMTQIAALSRLFTWFGKQDEVIQASVLGLLSDEMLGMLVGPPEAAGAAAEPAAGR
jgi:hypothetical protein